MPTETPSEVKLDLDCLLEEGALLSEVTSYEKRTLSLVTLEASLDSWERIQSTLPLFRASNIPALLLLRKEELPREREEIAYAIAYLRDWDQLSLHNVLEICESYIPETYLPILRTEAKTELRWLREWLQASHDSRISKYPGLPWRSYIRKIVSENYQFASTLLDLKDTQDLDQCLTSFLGAKKKVVCVFPKRWSKMQ